MSVTSKFKCLLSNTLQGAFLSSQTQLSIVNFYTTNDCQLSLPYSSSSSSSFSFSSLPASSAFRIFISILFYLYFYCTVFPLILHLIYLDFSRVNCMHESSWVRKPYVYLSKIILFRRLRINQSVLLLLLCCNYYFRNYSILFQKCLKVIIDIHEILACHNKIDRWINR